MSDNRNKSPNKNTDTARKIWLAGIGAYGRAFSEVQEGLSKAGKSTSKVFDELVEKGEVLETIVTHKGKEAFDKVSDKMGDGFDVDERIAKMRERLKRGYGSGDNSDSSDVEARLGAIEAKLDEVLKRLKPKPAPRKRAAPKKPASKK
ncbi:MAG: phasin family protein [Robiginitomaculum sp.]|nr:phasin family protein [Robiginitomaculum sp.]